MENMNFGDALVLLKNGESVQRTGWSGKGMKITLQNPPTGVDVTLPFLYLTTVNGKNVPWTPNQLDVLAEDWVPFGVAGQGQTTDNSQSQNSQTQNTTTTGTSGGGSISVAPVVVATPNNIVK